MCAYMFAFVLLATASLMAQNVYLESIASEN